MEKDQAEFTVDDQGVLRFMGRLCVPHDDSLRRQILEEAYASPYSIHPGSTKMYRDLRQHYWWSGMKKNMAAYVERCLTCQQIKAEHQRPSGLLKPLEIPEWKWERITMDFVTSLSRSERGSNAIWGIVDRLTKSAHFLPVKTTFTMPQYANCTWR